VDIRGRSNYPFRAPLTGPRIIPPSGRPCVGLTRLSSDRVAERRRESVVEAREGTDSAERRARGRTEGETASERARCDLAVVQGGGRGDWCRRACGERWVEERSSSSGSGGSGERRRERGREDVESWAVAELARTKGICGSSLSLARLLVRPSPPALSTRPRYAHTRATTRTHARMHVHKHEPRRAIPRARTHARRAAETAGTVGRGSAGRRIASLSPLLPRPRFIFLLPVCFSASLAFASSTLLLFKLTAGEEDKEAVIMKSFRDLQSAAPVPSWRAKLLVSRIYTTKRVQ